MVFIKLASPLRYERCVVALIEKKIKIYHGEEVSIVMKTFMMALAMVFAFNLIGSIVGTSAPVSFAQEEPAPEPKPEKPSE